ncbi:hypothetical protein LTR02_007102 [Friedmanniomyces endolithicus]|nr:hypothetical protein LTR94_011707 [Friedmanniomyces endolithicus]KAK0785702.1 hypothetical protein LTR59_010946 [Friedmanniomyces endolithicus]KAK0791272.1 hypothetical protein LTR38_010295 [Friedmanniomyces endolithicus]KAK0806981.1 hypothetical protein LTR75_006790 [Friedmanniomyces endolithicus]KAK0858738.1 hypothetical protein LTR03_000163 [Friedmanniomyces endolithicus]
MAMVMPDTSRKHDRPTPPSLDTRGSKDDQHARKKRSANQVRSKPAHPTVISNIIDSFEALVPPYPIYADDIHSDSGSLRSFSSDGASALAPSIARSATSPGFGMEYSRASPISEHANSPDAAPPPSIRTYRRPLGPSQHGAPSLERLNNDLDGHLRPASITSRTSSYSTASKEKDLGAKNKHSAESWIKRESISGEALSSDKKREHRKSLRRVTSQETLRRPRVEDIAFPSNSAEHLALSRAEQIISRSPAPLVDTKARLYLTDSGQSEEKVVRDSLLSETKSSEFDESPKSSQKAPASVASATTDQTTPSPKRLSPIRGQIVDSIPTRTSSLRATSQSPASAKRKEKKAKRATVAVSTPEELTSTKSQIPESSWADLGDDDETVKRIRELREQRKSRIEESRSSSLLEEVPRVPREPVFDSPLQQSRSEDSKRALRSRPAANRAISEPPSKAHKILGITESAPMPNVKYPVRQRPGSPTPESVRVSQKRLEDKFNASRYPQQRPATASSPSTPISLDYSYAQAINALQGAEREIEKRQPQDREPSKSSLILGTMSLPPLAQPDDITTGAARQRPKSARRRPDPSARWTHHPDLPIDPIERRESRRKSMTDVRRTRHSEDGLALGRRDSVEDAVTDFLQAPRLSRKVRHPRSGRVISFSEVGDPEGAAVFICVGMGLTRFVTAFYDDLATTLRLRLITVDRPGVGGSEPYPVNDRSRPLSWPDDVLAICQHLGISSFSLLAHSAGAIYALATALILPHLIKGRVHLLAPWIPPSQLEAISHPTASAPPAGALPRGQRILRVLPTSFFKAANSSFMTATSASLKPASKTQLQAARDRAREQSMSPTRAPDRPSTSHRPEHHRRESMMLMDQFMPTTHLMDNFPLPAKEDDLTTTGFAISDPNNRRGSLFLAATATPTDPTFSFAQTALSAAEHADRERKLEYTSRLTQRTWELATRDSNPATDLLVCLERNREIGFRYTDVTRRVVVMHGSEDRRVPVGNVRWLAGQMNGRAAVAGWTAEENYHQSRQGGRENGSRDGWADVGTAGRGAFCEVRVLEGEGHGLMASAPIMSDVLTEIAGYWAGEKRGGGWGSGV